jgi:hypothetical protein
VTSFRTLNPKFSFLIFWNGYFLLSHFLGLYYSLIDHFSLGVMQAQPSKDITHAMPLSYPSLTEPMSGPSWYKPMPDSSSHMLKSLAQQDKRRSVFLLFFRPNDEAVVLIIWSHEYKGTYINIKDCVLPRHCPRLPLSRICLLTLPLISVLYRVFTSLIVCLPLAGLRSVPSVPACHMRP